MSHPKQPTRSVKTRADLGKIEAIKYNDAAGADKVIIVQPDIVRTTAALENVGPGKLIKIAAAAYGLDMVGKAYDTGKTYQKGDVVTESANVYLAMEDRITGAFDAAKWRKVATKVIAAIPSVAGDVVTTGRWHNAISIVGFLVADDSQIDLISVRD